MMMMVIIIMMMMATSNAHPVLTPLPHPKEANQNHNLQNDDALQEMDNGGDDDNDDDEHTISWLNLA